MDKAEKQAQSEINTAKAAAKKQWKPLRLYALDGNTTAGASNPFPVETPFQSDNTPDPAES